MIIHNLQDVTVDTPQGVPYEGKRIATDKICGVSILRAGETMENALCEVLKDVRIGKILIQTNQDTSEPEVRYKTIFFLISVLLNPADAQNVSCLGLCGRDICPKSYV